MKDGRNFVRRMEQMLGRDDNEADEEIIGRMDGDRAEWQRVEIDRVARIEEGVGRANERSVKSGKFRSVSLVDFGRDRSERFASNAEGNGDGDGEGGVLELDVDNWQATKENKNVNLVDMGRMAGRNDNGEVDETREGDILKLDPDRADRNIRTNKHQVGESIGRQMERWGEDAKSADTVEDVDVPNNVSRYGKMDSKSVVRMATQIGRTDNDNDLKDLRKSGVSAMIDDLGVDFAGGKFLAGDGVVLDNVNPQLVERRKGAGGPKIVLGGKERGEMEVRRKLDEHRRKRTEEKKKRKERRKEKEGQKLEEDLEEWEEGKQERYRNKAREKREKRLSKSPEREREREREREKQVEILTEDIGKIKFEL